MEKFLSKSMANSLSSASIKRPVEDEALSHTKEDRGLRLLAKAIVVQACDDLKKAKEDMLKHPEGSKKHSAASEMLDDCKEFFASTWCKQLMGMRF